MSIHMRIPLLLLTYASAFVFAYTASAYEVTVLLLCLYFAYGQKHSIVEGQG